MTRNYRIFAINIVAIVLIGAFISFLFLRNLSPLGLSKDQNQFNGCYYFGSNTIKVMQDGKIGISGYQGARYRVVAPVPGKHGFLLQVSSVYLSHNGEIIIAKAGNSAFLWPVSDDGILSVAFAPDFVNDFSKGRCN